MTAPRERNRVRGGRAPIPAPAPMSFRDNTDVDATLASIDACLADHERRRQEATT